MKAKGNIINRIRVTFFALTIHYLIFIFFQVRPDQEISGVNQSQKKIVYAANPKQESKLTFGRAAAVKPAVAYLIADKESLPPVVFSLALLAVYPFRQYLFSPSGFVGACTLYLFRILPNAP